ncbi:MAG: hypothetical protein H7296_10000 [Bacteroidia bacterium]|nr:hypothetical protein [Bacteroidia bacterium]
MKLIDKIKNKIGRFLLHKGISKNKNGRSLPSFEQLLDIGIVYNANEKNNEEKINLFANYLRGQGKKVFMLGYVDAKILPPSKKFHITSEYFWKEKLTKFNLPDAVKIGRFLETPFDLLMNIYYEDELPLQAISVYSRAKYRIGAKIPNALVYNDTVIDTSTNKDLQNLASQMVHYLKVVSR